jgi:hypothetical protein
MSVATIKLNYPIKDEDGKTDLSEIAFPRRPRGGDLIGTSGLDLNYNDLFLVTARVTNKPPSVYHQMDLSDVLQLSKVVANFLQNSPQTGEKS